MIGRSTVKQHFVPSWKLFVFTSVSHLMQTSIVSGLVRGNIVQIVRVITILKYHHCIHSNSLTVPKHIQVPQSHFNHLFSQSRQNTALRLHRGSLKINWNQWRTMRGWPPHSHHAHPDWPPFDFWLCTINVMGKKSLRCSPLFPPPPRWRSPPPPLPPPHRPPPPKKKKKKKKKIKTQLRHWLKSLEF